MANIRIKPAIGNDKDYEAVEGEFVDQQRWS